MADETEDTDDTTLFQRLKSWLIEDRRSASEQYEEIDKDYDFYEGEDGQWEDSDIAALDAEGRPHTTFNFIQPSVSAVNGMEVSNRHEVTYKPRTTQKPQAQPPQISQLVGLPQATIPGADDQGPAELYTAGAKYFRDECGAEDEESDAFQDTAICGMGWTETRIDFEDDPNGNVVVDRCDPGEMGWDRHARKRNLVDSRRFHRVREIDKRAALDMFPEYDLEDIDAKWARPHAIREPHDREAARNYESGEGREAEKNSVTVAEITWFELEKSFSVANPTTGEVVDADEAGLKRLKDRAKQAGIRLAIQTKKKRVYKQAFLGATEILGEREGTLCQSQKGFKFNCMTGTRARNKKQWTGIVRAMRDPQRWANALYSSTLWTVMTSGKGIMAERDAFENPTAAEADWSSQSKIVFLKTGALSGQNPKIMQKVSSPLPPGIDKLMEFAISAMRGVSGVNLEMLGAADREQAASLEYQRRQSATTILAPFFDGLRRYRKNQGRVLLDLIDRYMSDGRLIRIAGPDYEQYVPLIRDPSVSEFDIIVDESPSSPNQKEASWMMIQQLLPVVGKNLGPRTTAALLEASPLSTSVVKQFKDAAQQEQQDAANAPPPPEVQKIQAEIGKINADTALKAQELQVRQVETAASVETARMDMEDRQMERVDRQAQREHDFRMRGAEMEGKRMEMGAAQNEAFSTAAGADMPAKFDALGQGLQALAAALGQGMTALAQSNAATQATMQELARMVAAPRVTEIQADDNGIPSRAVSTVASVQ